MEIAQPNLDLLLEEPPAEPAPWTPTIEQENVYWLASRKMVQCRWWDSKHSKRRVKSKNPELSSDMDDEAKCDAVNSAVAELQEFYDNRHNLENNMPGQHEADDGVSAESATGEPVHKSSKTETEPDSSA